MHSQPKLRTKRLGWLYGLGGFLFTPLLMLAPVVLALHGLGELPLPAGLLYPVVLPLSLLFGACLVKFPWDTKLMMIGCAGGLLAISLPAMKTIRERLEARGVAAQSG